VEGMVRDGCQSGPAGCPSLRPSHPNDLAQKWQRVILNSRFGGFLAFPRLQLCSANLATSLVHRHARSNELEKNNECRVTVVPR
jgi:hypothetical protein